MNLIQRVKTMLGLSPRIKAKEQSYIGPDVSKAVQRNEMASERVRQTLENIKMADTLADIAGKMQ